jgi:prepilin-type processing-associated H-X9-DG protein
VELLVVIAIIAILIGLLLPAVQKVRDSAARTQCANNMKQIGLAQHNYHNTYNSFPCGVKYTFPYYYYSWMAQLLPFVEQDGAWSQADTWSRGTTYAFQWWPWGDFWDNPTTPANPVLGVLVKTWTCPADRRTELVKQIDMSGNGDFQATAFTAYLGNAGIQGDFGGEQDGVLDLKNGYIEDPHRFADITDGSSNTIFVGERPPSLDLYYGWWFAGAGFDGSGLGDVLMGAREVNYANALGCPPTKVGFQQGSLRDPCDQVHWWSLHTGGGNFLICDGSVRFYDYGMNKILPQLCTKDGGEVVDY